MNPVQRILCGTDLSPASEPAWAEALITPPYQVGAFVSWRALALIVVAAMVGYVFGGLIGAIWRWVHQA
jgi:hypothetical protein